MTVVNKEVVINEESSFNICYQYITRGLCASFFLEAPGGTNETVIENMEPAEITVGLSVSTLSNPFFVSLEEGVNTLATENGTQVISVDAQEDSTKQSNDVDELIQ